MTQKPPSTIELLSMLVDVVGMIKDDRENKPATHEQRLSKNVSTLRMLYQVTSTDERRTIYIALDTMVTMATVTLLETLDSPELKEIESGAMRAGIISGLASQLVAQASLFDAVTGEHRAEMLTEMLKKRMGDRIELVHLTKPAKDETQDEAEPDEPDTD